MKGEMLNFCKDCVKKRIKLYGNSEEGKIVQRKRNQKRMPYLVATTRGLRKKFPERFKARSIVSNAVRSGKLVREKCLKCPSIGEAHHEDYSKPLNITWLCRKHHSEHHHSKII